MTERLNSLTVWVCTDCMYAGHGIDDESGHTPDQAPWALWNSGNYGSGNVSPGLTAEEHNDDCPNFVDGDFVGNDDEPCETQSFSWSDCDGCGSALGGERHAFTVWTDEYETYATANPAV